MTYFVNVKEYFGLFQHDETCWVEAAEKNERGSAVKTRGLRNLQEFFHIQAYHCRNEKRLMRH